MSRATPTLLELNLDALRSNFSTLRSKINPKCSLMAIVKSDAYGHGALVCAKVLEEEGADFFGVGTLDEAIELREGGIKKPILMLLGFIEHDKQSAQKIIHNNLTTLIENLDAAVSLNDYCEKLKKPVRIHIKLDTGMGRLGLTEDSLDVFCKAFKQLRYLECEGVLSHLADSENLQYTELQRKKFSRMLSRLKSFDLSPKWIHLANSAEAIEGDESESNLARLGLVLYGSYPYPRLQNLVSLTPVMSLRTKIVSLRKVPAQTYVSYNRTFQTKRESIIGTLPVGYADGFFRSLSNASFALVGGKKVPIVGTICMDMMMVDLTDLPEVSVGENVVLLGKQGRQEILADSIAKQAGTISYEIFCSLSKRLSRCYVGEK